MDASQRALTTALVEGTLRNRSWLDFALSKSCNHSLESLPPLILQVLRMGAFQLLFHDRQADAVVVSDSVDLARRCGHEGTAALVNAVLRSVARDGPLVEPPDIAADPVAHISLRFSHPEWLVRRWVERLGVDETLLMAKVNGEPPHVTLRVNPLRADAETMARELREEGFCIEPGSAAPGALRVRGSAHLVETAAYRRGGFSIQGEGSMIAGLLVSPPPGARVVDMCAGTGGKTSHLAQIMGGQGQILACDTDGRRLAVLQSECVRLGIGIIAARQQDARTLAPTQDYDCCLVDAPCSGTGSLRRRPDIRWRRKEEDIASLAQLQRELLTAAAGLVSRAGWIVYCTCSLEPEENEQVVEEFLSARPEFRAVECRPFLPMLGPQDFVMDGRAVLLLPHRYGTDGMFMMRMQRT
jgi:16S rRNA (cytosine967-C5)-methyltransferase